MSCKDQELRSASTFLSFTSSTITSGAVSLPRFPSSIFLTKMSLYGSKNRSNPNTSTNGHSQLMLNSPPKPFQQPESSDQPHPMRPHLSISSQMTSASLSRRFSVRRNPGLTRLDEANIVEGDTRHLTKGS